MAKRKQDLEAEAEAETPSFGLFDWGQVSHDLDALPHELRVTLIQRALAHIQGNQVAASRVAWDKKNPNATDEEKDAETLRLRQDNYARMLAGTYGLRRPSEASSSVLEDIALELAKEDAFKKLHTDRVAAGLPSVWPQGTRARKGEQGTGISGEDATVTFGGVPMTRADIARAMFNKNPEAYLERAKLERERRNAEAKAKKEANSGVTAVKSLDDTSLDDLI